MNTKNIVFIGVDGSYKVAFAKHLSKLLKYKFYDLEHEIVKQAKLPKPQILRKRGVHYFQKLEKYILRRLSKLQNTIIVLNEGTLLNQENNKLVAKNSLVIHINPSPQQVYQTLYEETPPTEDPEVILERLKSKQQKEIKSLHQIPNHITYEPVFFKEYILLPKKYIKENAQQIYSLLKNEGHIFSSEE